jgi:hypothetical protein
MSEDPTRAPRTMYPADGGRPQLTVPIPTDRLGDHVARWEQLRDTYPEAVYTFGAPWFYGALREADDIMRASSLGRLIDSLLARERETGKGHR